MPPISGTNIQANAVSGRCRMFITKYAAEPMYSATPAKLMPTAIASSRKWWWHSTFQ